MYYYRQERYYRRNEEVPRVQHQDITKIRLNKAPQSVWDDPSKMFKINDPSAITEKILSHPRGFQKIFKDTDKDGVPDVFDCAPNDPNKQGLAHRLGNLLAGRGFVENEPPSGLEQRTQQVQRQQTGQRVRRHIGGELKAGLVDIGSGFKEFGSDLQTSTKKSASTPKRLGNLMGIGGGFAFGQRLFKEKKKRKKARRQYVYVRQLPKPKRKKSSTSHVRSMIGF